MILNLFLLAAIALWFGWRVTNRGGWVDKLTPPMVRREPYSSPLPTESSDGDVAESPEPMSRQEEEAEIDEHLKVSAVGLGLAGCGALFFPPLQALSAATIVYSTGPIYHSAFNALWKERRLRASVVESVVTVGMLMSGYYVAGALTGILYFAGRKLLLKTEDRSRKKLGDLFGEQPNRVWVLKDGVEVEIPITQLAVGDVVVVNAGQAVPVDGVIRTGHGTIDQHVLTGETHPVERGVGEQVFATTLLLSGYLCITVARTGSDTQVAQIARILNKTADYRSFNEARSERLVDGSVLPMLSMGGMALLGLGSTAAISVLGSNFIENMRIAGPLGVLNFLTQAANSRILIKDGRVLELLSGVDTVVFDKTGTLTLDEPHVGSICPAAGYRADILLSYAAAAEGKQSHPIAKAILSAAAQASLTLPVLDDATYQLGYGVEAKIGGRKIRVGSARYMAMENIAIPDAMGEFQAQAQAQGYSLLYIAVDSQLGGILELRPTVRPEVPQALAALRQRGLKLYMISGDHEAPTKKLASELALDHYFAEVLAQDKAALVRQLQAQGSRVCFVGDGVNDAIALKQADASISLSGATTIATDTAQVIMMDGSLLQLPSVFVLADAFNQNSRQSLAISIAATAFGIGGVFLSHFGILTIIALYNASLLACTANAMLPALRPVLTNDSPKTLGAPQAS